VHQRWSSAFLISETWAIREKALMRTDLTYRQIRLPGAPHEVERFHAAHLDPLSPLILVQPLPRQGEGAILCIPAQQALCPA